MNRLNPLANALFPASSNSWDFLKEMILMVSRLACLGGNNYILSGCVDNGQAVTPGYIIANGEILPFEGGAKSDYIIIIETTTGVNANGVDYPGIYTSRIARFGDGVGQIAWNTFVQFKGLDLKANAADVYTQAQTNQLIQNLINNAPGALDTLKELSDALGADPNFSATIINQLSLKANSGDSYTKAESLANSGGLLTKSYDVFWDMDTYESKWFYHGLDHTKIVSVEAMVFENSGARRHPIDFCDIVGNHPPAGSISIIGEMVDMHRRTDYMFDTASYAGTANRRAKVIIQYEP